MGEIRRQARHPDDVARALTIASDRIESDEATAALPYLEWAKDDAPRAPAVREALGIAYYLSERWSGALSELQTYRRLTDRQDQNHLIADCLRALERPMSQIAASAEAMRPDVDGEDRVAEAFIVWASALADAGDTSAGRAVLRRVLERPAGEPAEHDMRAWYVAGDLAERDGDTEEAIRWFRRVASIDPDLFDVEERLERLES